MRISYEQDDIQILVGGCHRRLAMIPRTMLIILTVILVLDLQSCRRETNTINKKYYEITVASDLGSVALCLDHYHVAMLLMLNHYWPSRFSFESAEVTRIVERYTIGNSSEKTFKYVDSARLLFEPLLDQFKIDSATTTSEILYSLYVSSEFSNADINLVNNGFHMPEDIDECVKAFVGENYQILLQFERDVIDHAKKIMGPVYAFLNTDKMRELVNVEKINILITFTNTVQTIKGSYLSLNNNRVITWGISNRYESINTLLHELIHAWFERSNVKKTIEDGFTRNDIEKMRSMILADRKSNEQPVEQSLDSNDSLYEAVDTISCIGFDEYFTGSYADYLASVYSSGEYSSRHGFVKISSIDNEIWGNENDLYNWIEESNYYSPQVAKVKEKILHEYYLFAFCIKNGVEYAVKTADNLFLDK